jgi:hypothetical protein
MTAQKKYLIIVILSVFGIVSLITFVPNKILYTPYLWNIEKNATLYFDSLISGDYDKACEYIHYYERFYDYPLDEDEHTGCDITKARMNVLTNKGIHIIDVTDINTYFHDDLCGMFRATITYEDNGVMKTHKQEYSIQPCGSDASKFHLWNTKGHPLDQALHPKIQMF